MSFKTFIEGIFPFLFDAIKREFDALPDDEQKALIQAGQFGQIIKTELNNGYHGIVTVAGQELGLQPEQVDQLLIDLAKKLNIDLVALTNKPEEFINKLQSLVNKGMEDSAWDNLWHSVSSQLAIIISGGKFNWAQLAIGLIQFVFEKFVPKATV